VCPTGKHSGSTYSAQDDTFPSYFSFKGTMPSTKTRYTTLPFTRYPSINSGTMRLRAVVVADNEAMQLKIDTLTTRVQELERALQETRGSSSSNDPMLEDLPTSPSSTGPSSVTNGSDRESHDSYGEGDAPQPHLHSLTRSTGTLSLGTAGDARFFGSTARSDYLVHVRGAGFTRFGQG
jgi:hypothetical protein